MKIQEWFEGINLFEASVIAFIAFLFIRQMIRLYIPLKNFVNFVDTMQSLPDFIDLTNRRFLVLFKRLNIDPHESDREEFKDPDHGEK